MAKKHIYNKKYYDDNKGVIKEKVKQYRNNNKEIIQNRLEEKKKKYENFDYTTVSKKCSHCKKEKLGTEFHKEIKGKYGLVNVCKKCKSDYKKKWRKETDYFDCERDKINATKRKYERERRKKDITYKIKTNIRNAFNKSFKRKGLHKYKLLEQYGIDIQAIIEHLGQPPNDDREYHIDHIFPVSAFDFTDDEQIKKCWQPENLRWLLAEENLDKSDKYDEERFKTYIQ